MQKENHKQEILSQVPPNYYQKGVKENFLQRYWHTKKLNTVLANIEKPRSILDVGCASGWFLSQIKKKNPKSKCCGVDVYKQGIIYGKKRYPSLFFKIADAHHLPYKNNSFDVVICTEVLEHIENPKLALLEIKRVLKKNGTAVIELDSGSILFSIAWFLWKLGRGGVWHDAHLHSFNIQKLEGLLKKTGFKIKKYYRFNFGMAMIFVVEK